MTNDRNETVSLAALWITLFASIVFLVQQLASVGIVG